MKKRMIAIIGMVVACVMVFAACGAPATPSQSAAAPGESAAAPAESAAAPSESAAAAGGDQLVVVLAKGFQHQFWQTVKAGADQAAKDLGVTIDFQGPASESDIPGQVDQFNSALAKKPAAIALAALDTQSVTSQLQDAMDKKIPVVGFDSGVPEAPEGQVAATAATDNKAAAALAAENMMKDADFLAKLKAATEANPVTIAVVSQDATSASVTGRTEGFIAKMKEEAEKLFPGQVAVIGHDLYKQDAEKAPVVNILAQIAPTTDAQDLKNAAQAALDTKGIIGIFCSNEGTVGGMLNATSDGKDLGDGGKYAEITVAGFDAGAPQKEAVRNGWFIGSVTQDPFQIGYKAVELAADAANGKSVADVDTGARWYDATNIDDEMISQLVYD